MTGTLHLAPAKRIIIAATQALLLAAFAGASATHPQAQAQAQAQAQNVTSFIQQTFDDGFAHLGNAALSPSERRQRFHETLLDLIDVRSTAYYTLGDFAAEASPQDMDAFVRAFQDYAAASYAEQFGGKAQTALKVTGLRPARAGDVLVSARLVRPNATAKDLTFRVRNPSDTGMAVVDVQVDGIWLSTLERADFSSFLSRNNGNVAKLTEQVSKIAENIRTNPQG